MRDVLVLIFLSPTILAVIFLIELLFLPNKKQEDNIKRILVDCLIIIVVIDFIFLLAKYKGFMQSLSIYFSLRAEAKERQIAKKLGLEASTRIVPPNIVFIRDTFDPQRKRVYLIDIGPDGRLSTNDDNLVSIFYEDEILMKR